MNDRIDDLNKHCLDQFRAHWQCLENGNHQLWQCRPLEWKLNKCAYENLVRPPTLSLLSLPATIYDDAEIKFGKH